jgi:transcriptional regulator with XRE-family HTH domain
MAELLTPQELETLARANGKSMAQVCRETNIAPSTFTRWKRGQHEPTLGIYRRLTEAASKQEVSPADHRSDLQTTQPTPSAVSPL